MTAHYYIDRDCVLDFKNEVEINTPQHFEAIFEASQKAEKLFNMLSKEVKYG